MNFVADESLEEQVVAHLRQAGHQVFYVAEMEPGVSDDVVLERANQAGALLITGDRDFGELVFRAGRVTAGVILVRLAGVSPGSKADIVVTDLEQHAGQIHGAFTVISPGRVRIRHRLL